MFRNLLDAQVSFERLKLLNCSRQRQRDKGRAQERDEGITGRETKAGHKREMKASQAEVMMMNIT